MASFDQRLISSMEGVLGANNLKDLYKEKVKAPLSVRSTGTVREWVRIFAVTELWPNFVIGDELLKYSSLVGGMDGVDIFESWVEPQSKVFDRVIYGTGPNALMPCPEGSGVKLGLEMPLAVVLRRLGLVDDRLWASQMRGEHHTAGKWMRVIMDSLNLLQDGYLAQRGLRVSNNFLNVQNSGNDYGFIPTILANLDPNQSLFEQSTRVSLNEYQVSN